MAKKKGKATPAPAKPIVKPEKSPDLVEADELGIQYRLWKPGVYSFICPAAGCPFDAVELHHLKEHITKDHLANPPASKLVLADKYGNVQPGPPGSGGNQ